MKLRITGISMAVALAGGLALGGYGLGAATASASQMAQAQSGQGQQQQQQQSFSEDQLQSYADAVVEVQGIGEVWQPRINEASSEEEAQQMRQEAQTEAVEAVENQGLSVQEYNQIFQAAQSDPELYERIMTLIAEAQQ